MDPIFNPKSANLQRPAGSGAPLGAAVCSACIEEFGDNRWGEPAQAGRPTFISATSDDCDNFLFEDCWFGAATLESDPEADLEALRVECGMTGQNEEF
ncbi:hypothetical protein FACS1894125_6090 [Actinomycetota bacterium]|nr:hypothetical protein FACS1894125_6090 [Actinomycetota bacterium]